MWSRWSRWSRCSDQFKDKERGERCVHIHMMLYLLPSSQDTTHTPCSYDYAILSTMEFTKRNSSGSVFAGRNIVLVLFHFVSFCEIK